MTPPLVIRDPISDDEAAWKQLYSGYRAFYRLEPDETVVDRVWIWILNRDHGLRGLVAAEGGTLVALANVRTFARPSSGTIGLYLDDLFTSPEHRRSGAATALLARLAELAADDGRSVVRWITAESNATARQVYDAHATATSWVTYDMAPVASTSAASASVSTSTSTGE